MVCTNHFSLFKLFSMENASSFIDQVPGSPFDQIIPVITQAVLTERIYVTGRFRRSITVESIFNIFINPSIEETSFDLIVVVSAEEKRSDNELQDIIENRCKAVVPVTVLIMPVQKFRQLLESGHPFVYAISQSALQVYDTGNITVTAEKIPDTREWLDSARVDLDNWAHSAKISMEGAGYYIQNGHLGMAAFLLHQAAEHCYIALIRVMTGYRVHTHNLDKLMRYSRCFSLEINELFARNTPEEIHLFQLLQRAYVDARYKYDYVISPAEIQVLTARIRKLHALVLDICGQQLRALENNTPQ